MAVKVFDDMYREFSIGCTLNHPGIVEYKYFVRQTAHKSEQEFHIFIELMDGGNLEEYLGNCPLKREANIQKVRDIMRQITCALAYLHS